MGAGAKSVAFAPSSTSFARRPSTLSETGDCGTLPHGATLRNVQPRLAAFVGLLRTVFARETLPPAPAAPARRPRRGVASLLFAIEPLPHDPARPRPARPGLVALLLAPEPLPRDAGAAPRRRGRWASGGLGG